MKIKKQLLNRNPLFQALPGATSRLVLAGSIALFAGCEFTGGGGAQPDSGSAERSPINFSGTAMGGIDDRSNVGGTEAVHQANRVWASGSVNASDYVQTSRLLGSVLSQGNYSTPEERIRVAVIAMQHAHLARDEETMRTAVDHWEEAFPAIQRAPRKGEVETYLLTMSYLDELPRVPHLLQIVDPDVARILEERR